jgi:hypothetical protein
MASQIVRNVMKKNKAGKEDGVLGLQISVLYSRVRKASLSQPPLSKDLRR